MLRKFKNNISLLLFILLWGTYAYFYQAGQHNEISRFEQVKAIVERGQLHIDPDYTHSADIIFYPPQPISGKERHLYPNKAPGTSFIGVPFFFLFDKFFGLFAFPEWLKYHFICHLTTIFTINLFSAFCGVCIYWFLLRISRNVPISLFVTFAYTLGTIAFPFATVYFSHQLAASLVFIFFYSIFAVKDDYDKIGKIHRYDYLRLIGGAFAGGYAFATEYPAGLALAAINFYAIYVLWKRKIFLPWVALAIFFFIGIAPLILYNIKVFGKIWYEPYSAYIQPDGKTFEEHKKGYMGVQNPLKNPKFKETLKEITFRPQRGLFYCNPVLLLIFPGFLIGFLSLSSKFAKKNYQIDLIISIILLILFFIFYKSLTVSIFFRSGALIIIFKYIFPLILLLSFPFIYLLKFEHLPLKKELLPELILSLVIFISFITFNANYGTTILFWGGGYSTGPRHIIPMLPFLVLPILYCTRFPFLRQIFYILALYSIFLSLSATAVEPRAPYIPPDVVTKLHVPFFMEGKLAICTSGIFSSEFTTPNSVAYNFGKLIQLKPIYQMSPLYIFWICIFAFLIPSIKRKIIELDSQIIIPTSENIAEDFVQIKSDTFEKEITPQTIEEIPIAPEETIDKFESEPVQSIPIDTSSTQVSITDLNNKIEQDLSQECEITQIQNEPLKIEDESAAEKCEIEVKSKQPLALKHLKFHPIFTSVIIFSYIILLGAAPTLYGHIHKITFTRRAGLIATYYSTSDFTGEVRKQTKDPMINFEWRDDTPLPGMFSIIWEGIITIKKPGEYIFITESDDASWLYIDDKLIVDNHGEHYAKQEIGKIFLTAGKYAITVKYANYKFGAIMKLLWQPPGQPTEIIPSEVFGPTK